MSNNTQLRAEKAAKFKFQAPAGVAMRTIFKDTEQRNDFMGKKVTRGRLSKESDLGVLLYLNLY